MRTPGASPKRSPSASRRGSNSGSGWGGSGAGGGVPRACLQQRRPLSLLTAAALALLLLRALLRRPPEFDGRSPLPVIMDERPQIVLFGDSITQLSYQPGGWGARLQDLYQRKADVVLRGFSGYNSRWAVHLLDTIFPKTAAHAPSLVTVFFGANDAALPDGDSRRQHVPLEEYRSNLRTIIAHLKSLGSGTTQVLLIAPPPIDVDGRQVYARQMYGELASGISERTNPYTGQYAAACIAVGLETGCPVLDTWSLIQKFDKWQTYLSDGLHLSPLGNEAVFNALAPIIKRDLPHLDADALPMDFPNHRDVDSNNPAAFFARHILTRGAKQ